MPGNLTPPIYSETLVADSASAGFAPQADAEPVPVQRSRDPAEIGAVREPILDSSLLEEVQTLRQWQEETSRSRLDLIESQGLRERELAVRLDQAQEIIEAGRLELARVQTLKDEHRLALSLQQEQHHSQLREVQDSLTEARQQIERGQADLHGLRQRCAFLEQEHDQWERCVRDLQDQLQAAREQLAHRGAELATAQQRCEELEQQRLQSERESAALTEALQHELQAARDQLVDRSAELAAAQQRCDGLEQQRLQSERESAARMEERERQRAAAREAAEADQRTVLSQLEIQRLQDELSALQQLLEELPDIYEHKFRQRLQPLREQRDWLLHENNLLRSEWTTVRPELPAAPEAEPAGLAPSAPRSGLLQGLRALLPLGHLGGRSLQASSGPEADQRTGSGAGGDQPGQQLSPAPDDAPPTAVSADPRRR